MADTSHLNGFEDPFIDQCNIDNVSLTDDEKRKVIVQRKLSNLRDSKEKMDDFNTKYDLSDLNIDLILSVHSDLRVISRVLDNIESDVSEIESDVKDAINNTKDYLIKHEKYVEGDEEPDSTGLSPYLAFTSLRMDLSNLTYRAHKSDIWIN